MNISRSSNSSLVAPPLPCSRTVGPMAFLQNFYGWLQIFIGRLPNEWQSRKLPLPKELTKLSHSQHIVMIVHVLLIEITWILTFSMKNISLKRIAWEFYGIFLWELSTVNQLETLCHLWGIFLRMKCGELETNCAQLTKLNDYLW